VPGISALLAARSRSVVAIGQAACYQTAAQIWALAGYDLVTEESGDTKRLGHITKRGSPAFRDALYQIGYHTASQCPPIGHTFLDARARGLDEVAATIHAAQCEASSSAGQSQPPVLHPADRAARLSPRRRRGAGPVPRALAAGPQEAPPLPAPAHRILSRAAPALPDKRRPTPTRLSALGGSRTTLAARPRPDWVPSLPWTDPAGRVVP